MQITKPDLGLALYGEITDEISRGDDSLINTKISVGVSEVYSYLNRFDTDTIFGASFEDAFLKQLCVNIIVWHLAALCNPNVSMEVIRANYEDAIKYLREVQRGNVRPNWPIRPDDPSTPMDEGGNIQWNSNPKRQSHY